MATRREELAEAATDYALEHGLIGLSLRPLAEALGTSDRMLLYHFRDKDDLVATILRTSTARSVASIRALPAPSDLRDRGPHPLARGQHGSSAALPAPLRRGCGARPVRAGAVRRPRCAPPTPGGWPCWPATSPGPGWTGRREAGRSARRCGVHGPPARHAARLGDPAAPHRRRPRRRGRARDGVVTSAARSPRRRRRAARRRAGSRGSGPAGPRRARPRSIPRALTEPSASRASAISRPRHCRSVPAQACPRRGGPSYAGWPAGRHAHAVGDGAVVAARGGGGADQRAELHQRHRPGGRGRLVVGEQVGRDGPLGSGHGRRRELHAGHHPRQDPPDVGVEHRLPSAEREGQHGRRGVVTDPRQRAQGVVGVGHGAAVLLGDRRRRRVQADGAAGVAQPAPGPDRVTDRRRSEVAGRGPAVQPGVVHREDAGNRCLLQHQLRDQDAPRGRRRTTPRQVARVLVVPLQQWTVEIGHVVIVGGSRRPARVASSLASPPRGNRAGVRSLVSVPA